MLEENMSAIFGVLTTVTIEVTSSGMLRCVVQQIIMDVSEDRILSVSGSWTGRH
jgi:hypothetical protein